MTRKLSLATIFLTCCMLQVAHAKSAFGDLRGTTPGPSGLPLPQVVITAHSLEESNDRQIVSGDDGSFAVKNLEPGHYELTAARAGFQSSSVTKVELSARQSLRVDITLALASQNQAVEVSAAESRGGRGEKRYRSDTSANRANRLSSMISMRGAVVSAARDLVSTLSLILF